MTLDYKGQVISAAINGEVKLDLEDDGLTMSTLFDVYHIPYAELTAFKKAGPLLSLVTGTNHFSIARLGNSQEAFAGELYDAYNRKVRKALFVQGKPLRDARGEYRYSEEGKTVQGTALMEIYDNCALLLPPDDGARRIPFCFVNGMEQDGFELTLTLNTGEGYSFIRLGHDTEPFRDCIEARLHSIRENAVEAVKGIDGGLGATQIAAIAKLMPEGVAAPFSRLHEIAPSFVTALEEKIAESRVADEFQTFKEICDPLKICAGVKSGLAGEDAENILWLIAPGKKLGTAAVELATSLETAAATFLYRDFDDWEVFRRKLNQAMEAIDFKRDVIRLTDEELRRAENSDYAMAVRRNSALRFIRSHFAGRLIHSSPEKWKKELYAFM